MTKMNYFSCITILILTYSIKFSVCWVFTDVLQYGDVVRSLSQGNEINGGNKDYDSGLSDEELMKMQFNLIYPDTKWCGAGNVADDYNDLGPAVEADRCCRDHDHCPEFISGGMTKHNLTNEAFYTRLSCKCDETFRKCLHDADSRTADRIGTLYFDVLFTKCYKKEYPVVGCKKQSGWLKNKCASHEFDTSGQKVFQWFDVPDY